MQKTKKIFKDISGKTYTPADPIEKRWDQSCKMFLKGRCSFGERCRFYHCPVSEKLIPPNEFNVVLPDSLDKFSPSQWEMEKYNISLDEPYTKQDNDAEIILIRHGLSIYNFVGSEFFYHTMTSFTDISAMAYQTNPLLIDADLHPYGVLMCQNNAKYLKKIQFAAVFVSPLARALQTVKYLFNEHPMKEFIKFIVLPECSEILSKSQDVSDIAKQIERYSDFFDFSKMQSDFGDGLSEWQVNNITDEKQRIYVRDGTGTSAGTVQLRILEAMSQSFPSPIEKSNEIPKRANQTKDIIRKFIQENKVNTQTHKIAVVTHNNFIMNFTARGLSEDGYVLRGNAMNNCQVQEVKL